MKKIFVGEAVEQSALLFPVAQKVRNTTNGSWWSFQVQPTKRRADTSNARSAPEEQLTDLFVVTTILSFPPARCARNFA
jgi:hypothetical protein